MQIVVAIFSLALGLAMAGATVLSGVLYERYGSAAYAVMAFLAAIGAVSAYVAHRLRR